MLRRALSIYGTICRTFGVRLRPIATFALLQVQRALSALTRAADYLLFPGFRRVRLVKPIFIIGNPRSGTTFLHRFLLHTERLGAFELWEMLLPAITARKLFRRVIHRFAPFSPARYHSAAAHETSLRDVETDDAMAFFHFFDGGFLWSYYQAWEDTWGSPTCRAAFDLDTQPAAEKERFFSYMEGCWKRNLFYKRRERAVIKVPTFTLRIRTLLERYPDAKLIYLVRDPVETIPSGMSMLTDVQEKTFDIFNRTPDEVRARYLENLYQASAHLYREFLTMYKSGTIPAHNLKVLSYRRMMDDLDGTMRDLMDFLDLAPDPSFWEHVRTQAEKQRHHQSAHHYTLERFNLSEARLHQDLADFYTTFAAYL